MPDQPAPPTLDRPTLADPDELLRYYLDWYRDTLLRKVDGLSDAQLHAPVEPLGWSPLGLIQHLGWVERRWLRWGFAAEDVEPCRDGDEDAEWRVDAPTREVLAAYRAEVAQARSLTAGADLATPSRTGGRFPEAGTAPSLGRILFHLLQEYARHVGQLDVARELIDGTTGE
jgi:uncharacterized damage-inducible protein DinB